MSHPVGLAPLTIAFVPEVQRHAADIRVSATTRLPHPYPADGAQRWIAALNRDSGREFHFALLANNKFVGVCGLTGIDRNRGTANYGCWIAFEHWNKGYATSAGRQLVELAHSRLGLKTLRAITLRSNLAAVRMLDKLGFRKVGERPSDIAKWPSHEVLCDFEKSL